MNLPTKPGSFVKPFAQALPRAAALFLGSFAFVNSIGDLLRPGFAADLWWIDLRFLPTCLARALLLPSAFFLVVFAARESYVLRQLPYNMAREVAALWVYYVKC